MGRTCSRVIAAIRPRLWVKEGSTESYLSDEAQQSSMVDMADSTNSTT